MWKHLRSGTRRTESLTQKGKTFSFVRKSTVTRPSLLWGPFFSSDWRFSCISTVLFLYPLLPYSRPKNRTRRVDTLEPVPYVWRRDQEPKTYCPTRWTGGVRESRDYTMVRYTVDYGWYELVFWSSSLLHTVTPGCFNKIVQTGWLTIIFSLLLILPQLLGGIHCLWSVWNLIKIGKRS